MQGDRKLLIYLLAGTTVYVTLGGWLTFTGVYRSGSSWVTAAVYASLVVTWPVAWAVALWPRIVRSGFSRSAGFLTAWIALQIAISTFLVYLQAAVVTSYFDAIPIVILALFDGALWYALLGLAQARGRRR